MRIGIDLGGTKIEGIAIAGRDVFIRERHPAPVGDYERTVEAVAALVGRIEDAAGQRGSVGIGIPGAVSARTGLIKNANSTWLIGRPFHADLERRLGRAVRIANDADCFTLSEATDGAAAGASPVFGVILGTGVGGGIAVAGALLSDINAVAGEWGHNPLPWPSDDERPGPACYCGKRGCIETFLSGPVLRADFASHTGLDASPEEISAAAERGESSAVAAFARYEDRLARSLSSVINILDPECIVLGGGLSNVARLYTDLPALLPRYVFSDSVETRLVPPLHGDSSGVRGAAWLWPDE
ncbi:MAG: ROK family protein [Rhodospirillaceae bacterium]